MASIQSMVNAQAVLAQIPHLERRYDEASKLYIRSTSGRPSGSRRDAKRSAVIARVNIMLTQATLTMRSKLPSARSTASAAGRGQEFQYLDRARLSGHWARPQIEETEAMEALQGIDSGAG